MLTHVLGGAFRTPNTWKTGSFFRAGSQRLKWANQGVLRYGSPL